VARPLGDTDFIFGVLHMDGSGENDPPIESLSALYDELLLADIEHPDVSVIHDESGWCLSAYRDGGLIFGQLGASNTERHLTGVSKQRVLELWKLLINGQIELLLTEPWKSGYMGKDE
jgi:hypothetical protein